MLDSILEWIQPILKDNQFAQGGIVVALLGALWMWAREVPRKIYNFFYHYAVLTIRLNEDSEYFIPAVKYIVKAGENIAFGELTCIGDRMVPGGNRYFFKWTHLVITSLIERNLENGSDRKSAKAFDVVIKIIGINKKKKLKKFLDSVKEARVKENYIVAPYVYKKLPYRSFDCIFSDAAIEFEQDVDVFLSSKDEYVKKGIPYHRGYVLYGPPGTGKTSVALALANKLGYDLSPISLKNQGLHNIVQSLGRENTIFLIEDIDADSAVVLDRDSDNADDDLKAQSAMTLTDVLSILDGVYSVENSIIICTTNCIDKLDAAVLRPGRIDKKIYFGYMDDNNFNKMCSRYFPKQHKYLQVPASITAAEVQNVYLTHMKNYEGFSKAIYEVKKEQTEEKKPA